MALMGQKTGLCINKAYEIMVSEKMLDQTILVTNKTDGGGEIGRNEVANTKGKKADYTLLTFNSGDLMPMIQNTANRSKNFRILAIMAVDKQLIFKGEKTKYQDFSQAIEAAKNGTKVVIGGSKGDDIATYEAMFLERRILFPKTRTQKLWWPGE